ncbi:APC family permease [Conexibacter woesei]|uniref:Amino acid permease-associated region n=1 Tax=Conexibacter woesei (strain DSM 14684 / CCUG 47730 / CIP 108061 / JCM 11494 / NBRC 100937 / ID131577) TaxID=469383 RepID=D3F8L4_CONWI|nr:APC family permease [Conexibacter woesei]ADB50978.1 amino acid permease-associated region [Conexibacter woesei DSM 14684]
MSVADTPVEEKAHLRAGSVGMWDLVFFVVAAAAPLSVMSGASPLAIQFGGVGAPGGYLLAGIVFIVFAIGFTAMSRRLPNAGAFYAYVTHGLGRPTGVGAALVAVVAYNTIAIGFVAGIGVFAEATADDVFGIHLPWTIWSLLGLVAIAFLGYNRITLSAKVLAVLLIAEVLILVVLAVPVILDGGADGLSFTSFEPASIFGPGVGALFVLSFGAFLGFESTAIYSEEARDPKRTIPRATFLAVAFMGLFYALIVWTVIMAFGSAEALRVADADPADMYFIAMREWVGKGASDVMHILIVTSTVASTLAYHNAASRYFFVLGREGVLPRALGRARPKNGAPGVASITQVAMMTVVVGVFTLFGAAPYEQTFLWLNGTGIVGLIALQALCSFAVVAWFWRVPSDANVIQRVIAPVVAGLALGTVVVLIVDNFAILTGAGTLVNVLLLLPVPIAMAVGVGVALRIRARDPETYAWLTRTKAADLRD